MNSLIIKGSKPIDMEETVDFERVIDEVLFTPEKVNKLSLTFAVTNTTIIEIENCIVPET